MLVRFTSEDGRTSKDFDFARLVVGRELQVAFAVAFDRRTGPSGSRKAMSSVRATYDVLRRFSTYLAGLVTPPSRAAELTAAQLDGYLLGRRHLRTLDREANLLSHTLRAVEGLSERFAAKLLTDPDPTRSRAGTLHSYSQAEFTRILAAARRDARAAAQRIRAHRALLERWRAGQVDRTADQTGWELGLLLDHVERLGDVPRHPNGPSPTKMAVRHGGIRYLMSLIHLPWQDAAAFVVLLIGLTGQNGGTIAAAPASHHRADGDAGGTATAIVELSKPRRGKRRSHMDVPLTALPDWLTVDPATAQAVTAKDELHSPFGVYMLLLELTGPARRLVGTDRLLVSWACSGGGGVGGGFRVGLVKQMIPAWGRDKAIPADPQPPDRQPGGPVVEALGVLEVSMARLRLTYLEQHQTAVAHTEQVLANEYLGRNRGNLLTYQRLVARVLDEQVATAKASTLLATLDERDIAHARQHPSAVADRFGIDAPTLKRVLAGELDTVLAACVDHHNGPHAPPGQPCRASFMRCLDCPCARATPQHLPVQVLTLDALAARRAELPPLEWTRRFAVPHAQLADALGRFTPETVAAARAATSENDRRLVDRFLARELDQA